MADDRGTAREYPPGMRAPVAGVYEQRNVMGAFTGERVTLRKGDTLPAAPRGFTWSMVEGLSSG